jgi:glycosyltransferase involved in cell wall biosynthesis
MAVTESASVEAPALARVDASSGVTVLIATYNRAGYLGECLDSVLSQSIAPAEVIVIDDGSDDATAEVVARHGSRVRYIRQANGGKASALNRALPEVRGRYVWIFDDDDVALPDSIARRLRVLESRPELGFVLSGHSFGEDDEGGRIRRVAEHRLPDVVGEQALRVALMTGCFVTMQSMLVRTEVLRRAGLFDVALARAQDYDMMLRLAAQAPFALLRESTFVFRRHAGARGPKQWRHGADDRQQLFRQFDAMVGRKLREATPLGDFLVPARAEEPQGAARRDAFLARAVVMASKGLVGEMFDDLENAQQVAGCAADAGARVSRYLCKAICTGYAYDAIATDFDAFLRRLDGLRRGPCGRRAAFAAARGLFTLAKSYPGSVHERVRKLRMAGTVLARVL